MNWSTVSMLQLRERSERAHLAINLIALGDDTWLVTANDSDHGDLARLVDPETPIVEVRDLQRSVSRGERVLGKPQGLLVAVRLAETFAREWLSTEEAT